MLRSVGNPWCLRFFGGPAGLVVGGFPGMTPAAGELGLQCVESLVPEPAELVQPRVNLTQRPGLHGVEPTSPLSPDRREPVLTQNAQMLGDGRRRQCELDPDHVRDHARGLLAVDEQLQNAPTHRVTEDVERVHDDIIPGLTYISSHWDDDPWWGPGRGGSVA